MQKTRYSFKLNHLYIRPFTPVDVRNNNDYVSLNSKISNEMGIESVPINLIINNPKIMKDAMEHFILDSNFNSGTFFEGYFKFVDKLIELTLLDKNFTSSIQNKDLINLTVEKEENYSFTDTNVVDKLSFATSDFNANLDSEKSYFRITKGNKFAKVFNSRLAQYSFANQISLSAIYKKIENDLVNNKLIQIKNAINKSDRDAIIFNSSQLKDAQRNYFDNVSTRDLQVDDITFWKLVLLNESLKLLIKEKRSLSSNSEFLNAVLEVLDENEDLRIIKTNFNFIPELSLNETLKLEVVDADPKKNNWVDGSDPVLIKKIGFSSPLHKNENYLDFTLSLEFRKLQGEREENRSSLYYKIPFNFTLQALTMFTESQKSTNWPSSGFNPFIYLKDFLYVLDKPDLISYEILFTKNNSSRNVKMNRFTEQMIQEKADAMLFSENNTIFTKENYKAIKEYLKYHLSNNMKWLNQEVFTHSQNNEFLGQIYEQRTFDTLLFISKTLEELELKESEKLYND